MKTILYHLNNQNRAVNITICYLSIIVICFLFLPISLSAIQIESKDIKEELGSGYYDFDELLDNYVDEEDYIPEYQPVIRDLSRALFSGSYNYVLETINAMKEPLKKRWEIRTIEISALIGKKEFDKAKLSLKELKKDDQAPAMAYGTIANHYFKAKKPLDVMRVCQDGLKRDAKSWPLLFEMGRAFNAIGRPNIAVEYLEASRMIVNEKQIRKRHPALVDTLAYTYMKLNRYKKIQNLYINKDISIGSTQIELIAKSKLLIFEGKFGDAVQTIDVAIGNNEVPSLLLIKSQYLILARDYREAMRLLEQMEDKFKVDRIDDKIKLLKVLVYQATGFPEKALKMVDSISSPDKILNYTLIKANIYVSLGRINDAKDMLKQSAPPFSEIATFKDIEIHLNPTTLGQKISLAHFCFDQGYYLKAISVLEKNQQLFPENFFINYIIAESLYERRDYTESVILFKKALTSFPKSVVVKFRLAMALDKAGDEAEALSVFAMIIRERPDFERAALAYSKILSRLNRWSDARGVLESGLNYSPDSTSMLVSYGWALCNERSFNDLDEFIISLEEKKNIQPIILMHLKGWAAYQKKDFVNARELLEQAMYGLPGNSEICYHLGMTELALGNKKKAENLLTQSYYFEEQRKKYKRRSE